MSKFGSCKNDLEDFYNKELQEHIAVCQLTQAKLFKDFTKLYNACLQSIKNGGKIIFFGNGGSAADSQHLATELTVRYKETRKSIAAIALTCDTSTLTAISNDFSFDLLFSRQIEAIGKKEDIAIGISTSGISKNVIKGLEAAKKMNIVTAALSGNDGGKLLEVANPVLIVPSNTTSRIQEMHITLGQMLCGAIEQGLHLV